MFFQLLFRNLHGRATEFVVGKDDLPHNFHDLGR